MIIVQNLKGILKREYGAVSIEGRNHQRIRLALYVGGMIAIKVQEARSSEIIKTFLRECFWRMNF